MTDPVITPSAPAAPAPAPVAPAPSASVEIPVSPPEATPAPETIPASGDPVVVSDAAKTLLGIEPPKVEAKVPEVKPEAKAEPVKAPETPPVEQKKEEGGQSAEPASPPAYEAFTLPEEVKLDGAKLGEFTKALGDFELAHKVDHAAMQVFGQQLMDKYVAETQESFKRYNEHLQNEWQNRKNEWKTSFESDPEIGGNRKDTTLNAALEFVRTHGGNEVQQKEFRELMDQTGVGNHPALIRILAKANLAMKEGRPIPATAPAPQQRSKVATRYGTKT